VDRKKMDEMVDNMAEIAEMMAKWKMDISEVFPDIDVGESFSKGNVSLLNLLKKGVGSKKQADPTQEETVMAKKTKKLSAAEKKQRKEAWPNKKKMNKLVDEIVDEMDHEMMVDEWMDNINKLMDEMDDKGREELLRKFLEITVPVPAIVMGIVSDRLNKISEAAQTTLNSVRGDIDEMEILAEISQLADEALDMLAQFVEIPEPDDGSNGNPSSDH
jgi:hypothetical protein